MTATQQAPVYSGSAIQHSIFGAINYNTKTTIASAATAVHLIESGKAETAISVDSSPIDQVISFYRSNFSDLELTAVATANETDTIDAAIEHNISLEIDGELFNTQNAKPAEKAMKRLQHATIMSVEELSKKTVLAQLRDVIPTPAAIKEAIDRTIAANHLVDPVMITEYANWYINKVRDRVLAGRRITTHTTTKIKTKRTMRTGNTHDRVKYKHEPVKNMRVLPMRSVTPEYVLKTGGVFVNKGARGVAKTEFAEELLSHYQMTGRKGMYVAHRRSIVSSRLQGIDGVTHYQEIAPGSESSIHILKICANSIIKQNLSEWMDEVGVLVIDEGWQTLRHILLGTVDRRDEVFYMLLDLIKRARTVLLMDADANDKLIEFIRMARPDEQITVLEKDRDMSGVTIEFADRAQVYGSIFPALKKERFDPSVGFVDNDFKPVMICSDRRASIQRLDAKIGRTFKKYKTLSLHSKNINGDDQQAFMASPNSATDIQAMLYSPAAVSSLSITNGYFGRHVSLFEGIIPATDSFQMLGRDRLAKHHLVGIKNQVQYHPDTVDQLLHCVENPTEFDRFAAEVEAEDNYVRNNFVHAMYHLAVAEGYAVKISDHNAKKTKFGKFWECSATAIENGEYRQNLLHATAASQTDESVAKKNNGETDESTAMQLERRRIEQLLCKSEITQDDVRAWKRGALAAYVANMETLQSDERRCTNIDNYDAELPARDRRNETRHHEVYAAIFRILGIDAVTADGEYTKEQATELVQYLIQDRAGFNNLRLKKKLSKTVKSGTAPVNAILKEFGLETQVREIAGRQRAYSITPESWERMMGYIETRKQDRIEKANAQAKKRNIF